MPCSEFSVSISENVRKLSPLKLSNYREATFSQSIRHFLKYFYMMKVAVAHVARLTLIGLEDDMRITRLRDFAQLNCVIMS